MKITLIQPDIRWENIEWNLSNLYDLINKSDSDIILLPELFTTGFTMKSERFAEVLNGSSHQWMKDVANEFDMAISGSLIIRDGKNYFNRLLFVEPSGETSFYDKRHLFRMGEEDKNYSPGKKRLTKEFRNCKVSPLICYDLRFPVWSRNTEAYDLLCYHANWPASRDSVWKSLLIARAIENQCFVAGINRVGSDGEGVDYKGNSLLIDPRGEIMLNLGNEENVATVELDLNSLEEFRKKFPVWKDADKFSIDGL